MKITIMVTNVINIFIIILKWFRIKYDFFVVIFNSENSILKLKMIQQSLKDKPGENNNYNIVQVIA